MHESHEMNPVPGVRIHDSRLMRGVYLTVGVIALVLAVLGIFLPVLPTTPFLILAAACFARSSERFYHQLLSSRIAGPILREWFEHRSISLKVKRWVYFLIILSFSGSIYMVQPVWLKAMLVILGFILLFFIWRIPVRERTE